jgi:hypothetical protein
MAEDDKRVLLITFVGGLAANVGLVLVVALGLLEAHLIHRYRHEVVNLVLPQIAASAALGLTAVIWVRRVTETLAA